MVVYRLPKEVQAWVRQLAAPLHGRLAWRLRVLVLGLLFATGRRTVASWLRAAAVGKDFKAYYFFLSAVGRSAEWIASRPLWLVWQRIGRRRPCEILAPEDSPT